MECSNFGCAVLGNKVYVVGGALVDDRGCSVGEFPETVHPFGFAFDPISEVGLLVKHIDVEAGLSLMKSTISKTGMRVTSRP